MECSENGGGISVPCDNALTGESASQPWVLDTRLRLSVKWAYLAPASIQKAEKAFFFLAFSVF